MDDADLERCVWLGDEQSRAPTAQVGPVPAPFTKHDWEEVLYAFDHKDEAGRCFKVLLGKYFLCGPGPSREYWIQYLLDESKPFLLLHVHFRRSPVGSADRTPIFSHVTSANAGFSRGDNVPGRFNQFMQRSIRDPKDQLSLTGGHPRIDSVASNSHAMGDYSEVDGRLPISGAQIKLGTGRPLVMSGPQGQLCSEWGKRFDFTNILGLRGTGADVSVVNLAAPEVQGEIATRVLLRVDLLRVQDLAERHRLFAQLQALGRYCYVGGSDFKLLSFEERYAPRKIGWDYVNHTDANGSHTYPLWPPPPHAEYAAIASAADLRRMLMHIEGVRQQWERPLPDGYYRRWGKKVQQQGPKPMEDEDMFRGDPAGPTRGGTRSGESEDRTPEKVQLKCSLTGPPMVPLGEESFELKVWLLAATAQLTALLKQQLAIEESKELTTKFAVAATDVTFRVDVTVEGCKVEPPCCLVKWTDQTLYPSDFAVTVPADFSETSPFQCRVVVRGVKIRIEMEKTLLRSPAGTTSPSSVVTTPSELASAVAAMRLELAEERAQMMGILARIDANVNVIKELSFENKQELRCTCDVLLKGMFEARGVQVPTTFVVLLDKLLAPSAAEKELLKIASDVEGNPFVPITEEAARVGRKYRRTLDMISVKWLRRLKRIGSDLAAGAVGEREAFETIKEGLGDLVTGKTMYLYLIDELTGEPVRDPTGHYPIEIKTPSDVVPKLLPIMQVGLRAMSIYNGAAGLARMFGFPIPTVPAAWATGARESVELLKHKSSVDDYGVVQAVLDQTGPKKESESVRGASLRELQRFFEKHDAQKGFAGLRCIGDGDGTAVWTALSDPSAIKAAIEARAKERLAEERRAAGGPE